jgi:hypothetical protein
MTGAGAGAVAGAGAGAGPPVPQGPGKLNRYYISPDGGNQDQMLGTTPRHIIAQQS